MKVVVQTAYNRILDSLELMYLNFKILKKENPMQKKSKEIDLVNKKPKYNESEIIKKFLSSKSGISFLTNISSTNTYKLSSNIESNNLNEKIDNLIDFYTSWANNFPVRKNLKMTKYEFLKSVEDFCAKNEINSTFKSILEQ